MIRTLSSDSLALIQSALRKVRGELEQLHWQVVPFLPSASGSNNGNATQVLRNISLHGHKLQKAEDELVATFEAQFTQKDHARVAGMSLYKYRKQLKERNENKKPVGNPRALRKDDPFYGLSPHKKKTSSRVG